MRVLDVLGSFVEPDGFCALLCGVGGWAGGAELVVAGVAEGIERETEAPRRRAEPVGLGFSPLGQWDTGLTGRCNWYAHTCNWPSLAFLDYELCTRFGAGNLRHRGCGGSGRMVARSCLRDGNAWHGKIRL